MTNSIFSKPVCIFYGLALFAITTNVWASDDGSDPEPTEVSATPDDPTALAAAHAELAAAHAELLEHMREIKTGLEQIPRLMDAIQRVHKPSVAPYYAEAVAQNTLSYLATKMAEALRLNRINNEAHQWFQKLRSLLATGLSPRTADRFDEVLNQLRSDGNDKSETFLDELAKRTEAVLDDFWARAHQTTYDGPGGKFLRFELPNEHELLVIDGKMVGDGVPRRMRDAILGELPAGSRIELAPAESPRATPKLHVHVPVPEGYLDHAHIRGELLKAYEDAQAAIQDRSGAHEIEMTSVPRGIAVQQPGNSDEHHGAEVAHSIETSGSDGNGDNGHREIQHVVTKFVTPNETAYVALTHQRDTPFKGLEWIGTHTGDDLDPRIRQLDAEDQLTAEAIFEHGGAARSLLFRPGMTSKQLRANRLGRWISRMSRPPRSEPPTSRVFMRIQGRQTSEAHAP